MTTEFEVAADVPLLLGEAPLWNPLTRRVVFTDVEGRRIHELDPKTGSLHSIEPPEVVAGMTLEADGALLLFGGRCTVHRFDGATFELVAAVPERAETRFNDVVADLEGRVYCGVMASGGVPGALYLLDRDRTLRPVVDAVGLPNGMALSADGRWLYLTDSLRRRISRWHRDPARGDLSSPESFLQIAAREGLPDGLALDEDGALWSARWDGGCVVRYGADGGELARIELPARRITSLCFAGEALDELYVTSAGGSDRPALGARAGALFRVRPGVRGLARARSRIGC